MRIARSAIAALLLSLLHVACGPPRDRTTPDTSALPPPETPRLAAHARALFDRFSPERALATVAHAEQYFRVRGNEGYHHALDRVRTELLADAAFAEDHVRTLELGDTRDAWTPRSASLVLLGEGGAETPLVTIATEADPDRGALLVFSDAVPAAEYEVVRLEAVQAGESAQGRLVLAEGGPTPTFMEVAPGGAAGVLVRSLEGYHQAERYPDSAQFGYLVDARGTHFGFSLSDRNWQLLRAATEHGVARVRAAVDVTRAPSAATAIEARIDGTDPAAGAVVFVAHVDEPGANDNASGVAALAELARATSAAIGAGAVPRPARTIVFVWGQEIEVSGSWLDQASVPVGAGLVFDMVGEDPAEVGGSFLIERMPDPGAVWLRAPDEHSEWGASEVSEEQLHGHLLNDYLLASVRAVTAIDGPWTARAHPYEGGSDHVSFLGRGMPAVLAWHFTDDAYHTTRDRLARVSGREMRRVSAAMGAVAIGLASAAPEDRREMLRIVEHGGAQRMRWVMAARSTALAGGATEADEQRIVDAWLRWYDEALTSVGGWGAADPALDAELTEARARVHREAGR